MGGRADREIDPQMDEPTDWRTNRWTDRHVGEKKRVVIVHRKHTDGRTVRRTDGLKDEQTNGRTDRYVGEKKKSIHGAFSPGKTTEAKKSTRTPRRS